ncbi:MAG: hypothetical protein II864_06905 [Prevotella sp.]|nr:hypothetical protein [Prevotella sp.]MBQ3753260.1 hypothetical protein [Prevotella sp.]
MNANCVSATADGSNCFNWNINSNGNLNENSNNQTNGRCVRLFRDGICRLSVRSVL